MNSDVWRRLVTERPDIAAIVETPTATPIQLRTVIERPVS